MVIVFLWRQIQKSFSSLIIFITPHPLPYHETVWFSCPRPLSPGNQFLKHGHVHCQPHNKRPLTPVMTLDGKIPSNSLSQVAILRWMFLTACTSVNLSTFSKVFFLKIMRNLPRWVFKLFDQKRHLVSINLKTHISSLTIM